MNISKSKEYTLVNSTENSFADFFIEFKKTELNSPTNHLILELSENLNTSIKDLLLLLDIAINYKANGMSFVIICTGIDIDEIPDEMNIVPTLLEAEDVLEMEAIERDLGF